MRVPGLGSIASIRQCSPLSACNLVGTRLSPLLTHAQRSRRFPKFPEDPFFEVFREFPEKEKKHDQRLRARPSGERCAVIRSFRRFHRNRAGKPFHERADKLLLHRVVSFALPNALRSCRVRRCPAWSAITSWNLPTAPEGRTSDEPSRVSLTVPLRLSSGVHEAIAEHPDTNRHGTTLLCEKGRVSLSQKSLTNRFLKDKNDQLVTDRCARHFTNFPEEPLKKTDTVLTTVDAPAVRSRAIRRDPCSHQI